MVTQTSSVLRALPRACALGLIAAGIAAGAAAVYALLTTGDPAPAKQALTGEAPRAHVHEDDEELSERWRSPVRKDGSLDPLHPANERGASARDPGERSSQYYERPMGTSPALPSPGKSAGRDDDQPVVPRANARTQRKDRWSIALPMQDAKALMEKLAELECILLIPEGPGKFRLFDLQEKKPEGKPASIVDINKMNRIWHTHRVPADCLRIADALGLAAPPDFFAVFLPQTLEQELFRAELAHAKLTEKEIVNQRLTTNFEVKRKEGKWDVKVLRQGPRELPD
jgi:hypothetical protein